MKCIGWFREFIHRFGERHRPISLELTVLDLADAVARPARCGRPGQAAADRQPHHLNAPGPFYSVRDCCIACLAPQSVAEDLMEFCEAPSESARLSGRFFRKQPETPEELDQAIAAMDVSCVHNLRYGGDDRAILKRLCEMGLWDLCDVFDRK
jgi:hypothetical protein